MKKVESSHFPVQCQLAHFHPKGKYALCQSLLRMSQPLQPPRLPKCLSQEHAHYWGTQESDLCLWANHLFSGTESPQVLQSPWVQDLGGLVLFFPEIQRTKGRPSFSSGWPLWGSMSSFTRTLFGCCVHIYTLFEM